ncbi:hypothetical protein V2J09_019050 [Rumex salicifolius]
MGPARGGLKKRRKVEKKGETNGFTEMEESGDWWLDFSKRISGRLPPTKGLDMFESIFKLSKKTFQYICSLVEDDFISKPGNFSFSNGKPMTLNDHVAVALRRLSSGDSLLNVGETFGLNQSTVSQVTWRFVEVMEEKALHHLKWPENEPEMSEIKAKFKKVRGLPNCCGAIETTHILMCLPIADPTTKVWCDHERNHSMVLQAVVDPDMRFRDIVTGWPGKISDSLVLKNSNLFKLCEKGKRLNGKTQEILEGQELREYIVGDPGFPLLPWLLTPYQEKDLPEVKAEFNKRHFATRMVALRALNRLKETWKIIQGVMWRPDKHRLPSIILVCCLLHNIVIDMEDDVQDEVSLSHLHDSGYRQLACESVDKTALTIRDKLALYLSDVWSFIQEEVKRLELCSKIYCSTWKKEKKNQLSSARESSDSSYIPTQYMLMFTVDT